MKCKTKDCKLEASAISYRDEPKARDKKTGMILNYGRTIKWRCMDGHINLTGKVVTAAELEPEPREKVLSSNRFKKKGFAGHAVNKHEVVLAHPPQLSNHQRHKMNQERRRQLTKMKQEAKV